MTTKKEPWTFSIPEQCSRCLTKMGGMKEMLLPDIHASRPKHKIFYLCYKCYGEMTDIMNDFDNFELDHSEEEGWKIRISPDLDPQINESNHATNA
ncbi:MAG TPA: hypothetical protein VFJ05_07010 [Nitrososphaeraceae archaeon]|nr:hypothetical protein [Nitrososphaeraceae archaeon]